MAYRTGIVTDLVRLRYATVTALNTVKVQYHLRVSYLILRAIYMPITLYLNEILLTVSHESLSSFALAEFKLFN